MAGSEQGSWWVAGAIVGITVAVLLVIWYLVTTQYTDLRDEVTNGIGTFLVALFGAGVVVFATKMGLKGYEKLPEQLYSTRNITLFIMIGGVLSVVLWLQTPALFTPLYSLGIGAAWPAVVQGLMVASLARAISEAEADELKDVLGKI